jgi:hypothetical protein
MSGMAMCRFAGVMSTGASRIASAIGHARNRNKRAVAFAEISGLKFDLRTCQT